MMPAREVIAASYGVADAVLAQLADLDRVRWDPEEPTTAEAEMSTLLTDPRRVDEINDALAYLEALAAMTAQEIARQQARQRAIDEAAYQLSRQVLAAMEDAKTTVAHGQRATLKARRNPPSVRIEDAQAIPAAFLRQPAPPPPVPDKTAIKAAIERDEYVPGAALVRSTRLERK